MAAALVSTRATGDVFEEVIDVQDLQGLVVR